MTTLHRWRGVRTAILFLAVPSACLVGQTVDTWSYRVQAGYAKTNQRQLADLGPILAFGITREILGKGLFRAGSDFALSAAGDGFVSFAGGLEFRQSPAGEFTLFAKMNWGYLSGSGYSGSFVAGTGGFLVRVGARTWLLFGVSRGDHGEEDGPHSILFGLERGFGKLLAGNGSQTGQGERR
jgi:hypothetical protein